MKSITLKSPAKINLYLRVIHKRKDGFHNIETIFERINLFDTIKLKKNSLNIIRIFCKHPDLPRGSSNLCFKAAQLLKDKFSVKEGADIFLKKRIPLAAGLGGGSSNAAFVLLGLNKLWHLGLTQKALIKFAAQLGSDVAFFASLERFAVGRGRGEKITRLKGIKNLWHILVVPPARLLTAKVYQRLNLRLTKKKVSVNILIHALRKKSACPLSGLLMNDLEQAAFCLQPALLRIKNKLKNLGLENPSLSGSGSAIFGLAESQKQAERLKTELQKSIKAEFFVVRSY